MQDAKIYNGSFQRRLSYRLNVKWPVTIFPYHMKLYCKPLPVHVVQSKGQLGVVSFLPHSSKNGNGFMKGETDNISAGGAFIWCAQPLSQYEVFRLAIEPADRQPLIVTAQVVSSDNGTSPASDGQAGMRVRFIQITDEDHHFIYTMVTEYLRNTVVGK